MLGVFVCVGVKSEGASAVGSTCGVGLLHLRHCVVAPAKNAALHKCVVVINRAKVCFFCFLLCTFVK